LHFHGPRTGAVVIIVVALHGVGAGREMGVKCSTRLWIYPDENSKIMVDLEADHKDLTL
jgi:hypothetical protein